MAFQWIENFLTGLEKYVKQIDTSRYDYCRINDHYFCHGSPFKIASDIRVICDHIFKIQHGQMKNIWFLYLKTPLTDII